LQVTALLFRHGLVGQRQWPTDPFPPFGLAQECGLTAGTMYDNTIKWGQVDMAPAAA